MKAAALSLLQSRKFWLTIISIASAVAAYRSHAISGDDLAKIISGALAVLVLAVSHEDSGAKSATVVNAGGPTTIVPSVPPPADNTQPVAVPIVPPKGP